MIQFRVEQFLPCRLPEVMKTIERKNLSSYESSLFLREELFAYPMNTGFMIDGSCGQFYLDSIGLLQSINGKCANEICRSESDFKEIEQYYHRGMIGYAKNEAGKIVLQDICEKYFELYRDMETTWFSYLPQKIEIDLTKKCNFKCIHCSKEASPFQIDGEMSLQDYVDFIEYAGKLNIPSLTLMGGEPTCNPEFIELAVIAKFSGVRNLSTSTNGWLVDKELAKKMSSLFNSIQVSIHGARSETHDRIVGRAGAFLRACNAVRLFKEYNVGSLDISFTVMKENLQEIPLMARLAQELGADELRFLVLTAEGRGKLLYQWTAEEKDEIASSIGAIREQNVGCIEVSTGGFPPYCDISKNAAFYGCPAGRLLMYINADGEVKPCHAADITIGKIRESSILELWHDQPMIELRRKLPCECPYSVICAGGCLGNPNWLGMFIKQEEGGIRNANKKPTYKKSS